MNFIEGRLEATAAGRCSSPASAACRSPATPSPRSPTPGQDVTLGVRPEHIETRRRPAPGPASRSTSSSRWAPTRSSGAATARSPLQVRTGGDRKASAGRRRVARRSILPQVSLFAAETGERLCDKLAGRDRASSPIEPRGLHERHRSPLDQLYSLRSLEDSTACSISWPRPATAMSRPTARISTTPPTSASQARRPRPEGVVEPCRPGRPAREAATRSPRPARTLGFDRSLRAGACRRSSATWRPSGWRALGPSSAGSAERLPSRRHRARLPQPRLGAEAEGRAARLPLELIFEAATGSPLAGRRTSPGSCAAAPTRRPGSSATATASPPPTSRTSRRQARTPTRTAGPTSGAASLDWREPLARLPRRPAPSWMVVEHDKPADPAASPAPAATSCATIEA